MRKYESRSQQLYLETRMGIITHTGDWFHTTSEHIEQFVPGLLKKRPLDHLVEEAVAWLRSADSLALTLVLILLIYIHPLVAVATAIAFHFFWYRFKSALVTIYMGKLLKMMNNDGYLLLLSLVIISYIGMQGNYAAGSVGLVFFFLSKLGLLNRLWDKIDGDKADQLSLNDRVFKMILMKYAIYFDLAPSEVKGMEKKIKELAFNRKQGKG